MDLVGDVAVDQLGAAFERDCEKYAEALCLGWSVLRVTPRMIEDGRLFAWLKKIAKGES